MMHFNAKNLYILQEVHIDHVKSRGPQKHALFGTKIAWL